MAIESYGYPKTIAPGDVFARFGLHAGKRYSVGGHSDFQVVKAATGTRQANISSGWSMGKNVLVHNTALRSLSLPAPAGTSQWHCIVINRWVDNVDPAYISTVTSVPGSTSRAIPALTTSVGGSLDQDPIALCRVTSGSTLIAEVVDLRLISVEGAGFYVAHSDLAMFRLNDVVGAEVYRTDNQNFYKRITTATGSLSWKNMSQPDAILRGFDAVDAYDGSGWGREEHCRMVRNGQERWLHIEMNRGSGADGGSFSSNGRGGLGDGVVARAYSTDRPGSGIVVPLMGRIQGKTSGVTYAAFGHMTSDGFIRLNSMLPNVTVDPGDDLIFDAYYVIT